MPAKKDEDMLKDVKVEHESDDDGLQEEVCTGHIPVSDVMLTMLHIYIVSYQRVSDPDSPEALPQDCQQ